MTWQDHITNIDVLPKAGMASMHSVLTTRRLRWLGHVSRMEDSHIPKNLLFGELASGSRSTGRPSLRFKDVCKRDLKAGGFNLAELGTATSDRQKWRATIRQVTNAAEERRNARWEEKRSRKKHSESDPPQTAFRCSTCGRSCGSRIGLHSHTRRCSPSTQQDNIHGATQP